MHSIIKQRIKDYLDKKQSQHNMRFLNACPEDNHYINLSSNDYLSLSKDPRVIQATQKAILNYGTSSSGSPLVSSYLSIHAHLQKDLEDWLGFPHVLLWTSGYAANHALLSLLPQKNDLILADAYMHNSALKGAMESKADIIRFKHNAIDHLEKLINHYASKYNCIFVITESLFSMDGDSPDLKAIAELKNKYNFFWIVDEAHAIGWYGPKGNGLVAHHQVEKSVDIIVATMGKSLASQGAFIGFHDPLLGSFLHNASPTFMYSTYLSPALVASAQAALTIIKNELYVHQPQMHKKTQQLCQFLKTILPNQTSVNGPIVPIIMHDNELTLKAALALKEKGMLVGAIRPPSVPQNTSRLRLSLFKDFPLEKTIDTLSLLKNFV